MSVKMWALGAVAGFFLIALVALGMVGLPRYAVWHQHMVGKAELARAEYAKQVAVQEALAKKNSAVYAAEADTIRALGAARANVILGESLKNNDAYLRYLWIQGLERQGSAPSVIYVPTEAGLPILEATRSSAGK